MAVAAGGGNSCALLRSGAVQCWGEKLGTAGLQGGSAVPVTIPGISNAVAMSASDGTGCVVLADGAAMCWGGDLWGACGGGKTQHSSYTPIVVGKP